MLDLLTPEEGRVRQLNQALEALHFAFRAVIKKPDERLAQLKLARVHHRLLYFIGHHPKSSMQEIIRRMQVTKQYLHRPLNELMQRGFVTIERDQQDRRIKRLTLTARGSRLEEQLSGMQRRRFAKVFAESGPVAEQAWHHVMTLLADHRFD